MNKVTLYLQRAKIIDSIRLGLRSNSSESLVPLLHSSAVDSFVVNNALKSAPSPESALSLVETLKDNPHFKHNQITLYTLCKVLAKSGQTGKLKALINAINDGKFTNIARISFLDRMQWFALAGDLREVLSVWEEWKGALQRRPCTESYNIIMHLFVLNGRDFEAVDIFRRLVVGGGLPNSRTYTIMIEHLVNSGHLDTAFEVFQKLPQMRVKRTLKQYSVLVAAFSAHDRLDVTSALLDEMQTDGLLPGRAMQSYLQRLQDVGYVVDTNMYPDKRIGNITSSLGDGDGDGDGDTDNEEEDENAVAAAADQVKLKPWLDPAALASALESWAPDEILALENAKFVWTTRLVCKMIRSFSSAETAWKFFCWVACQPGFKHDVHTISRVIAKLARSGHVDFVDQLLSKLQSEGIRLSFSTVRLIIDFYGLSGKGHAALRILRAVRTVCGPLSKSSQLILYTSTLRTLTKCGMDPEALEILEEMILLGFSPDIQTFSGLMNHFALQGDVKTVQRLFAMVRQSGLEADAHMYAVLIRAYCKCERASLAMRLFKDMRNLNFAPDVSTKEVLVKSLWKEGKLREAAVVLELCEEIGVALPAALPGNLFTSSSVDLQEVCSLYYSKFTETRAIK